MSPNLRIAISANTLRALLDFHSEQDSNIDPATLADVAIRDWLGRQHELAKPPNQRGYLWKTLFLPEGTRLRDAAKRRPATRSLTGMTSSVTG